MTLAYLGSLSIGAAVPGAAVAANAGAVGINGALPDITARLTALAAFTPTPVSFAAQLANAQATLQSIQLSITIGLTPPSIDAQIAEVAALVATLLAQVVAVNAQLELVTGFQALLAAAGIAAFAYNGPANGLAADLAAALASGLPTGGGAGASTHALVLATTDNATWSAMSQVFKVSA